jgi:hypothetical protein
MTSEPRAQSVSRATQAADLEALRRFLVEANAAGYAGGDEKLWTKEQDGSWTITFVEGDWKSHDNFFGGEPYGGRTIVSYRGRPVWLMVYYGWVEAEFDAGMAYGLLREALKGMPEEHPFRGPAVFEASDLRYENTWDGELTRFHGNETISDGGLEIYGASYIGRLVDQRLAT